MQFCIRKKKRLLFSHRDSTSLNQLEIRLESKPDVAGENGDDLRRKLKT